MGGGGERCRGGGEKRERERDKTGRHREVGGRGEGGREGDSQMQQQCKLVNKL